MSRITPENTSQFVISAEPPQETITPQITTTELSKIATPQLPDVVLPDILVLGKALTGGHIGHAVTVANHKIYNEFYSYDQQKALMHGPTFMGNPLACAASLASIELFERGEYLSKIKMIEEISKNELSDLNDTRIKEVRIIGGCACIEVYDQKDIAGFQEFAYDRGVFSRPFLKYIYSMVPYIIKDDELCAVLRVMKDWFKKRP